jgi:hypothetical protein
MENIRDVAQGHYNYIFKKMRSHDRKLKKGVEPLSYRPRIYIGDIEKVLGEVENFLMEHHPGVKIPPRPAILQKSTCRSSF